VNIATLHLVKTRFESGNESLNRDEGRKLPTPGRHKAFSGEEVLSKSGVSHAAEADLPNETRVAAFDAR
jgi:hypothetical protein